MTIEFRADERGGVTVLRDGHPQSHVDLDDPQLLAFEYVQHFALILDTLPPGPLGTTHIGGAGLTLARYLQATRPGSPQIVLEPDAELTDQVRAHLPLPRGHRIRVRAVTGAEGVAALHDSSADAVVVDAFAEGQVPADLTTTAAFTQYGRILKAPGLLLMNVTDDRDQAYLRRVLASAVTTFSHLAIVATHEVLKRKRFGNYVLIASHSDLDVAAFRRAAAACAFPSGVRDEAELRRLAAGAKPLTAEDSQPSPVPPTLGSWRVR